MLVNRIGADGWKGFVAETTRSITSALFKYLAKGDGRTARGITPFDSAPSIVKGLLAVGDARRRECIAEAFANKLQPSYNPESAEQQDERLDAPPLPAFTERLEGQRKQVTKMEIVKAVHRQNHWRDLQETSGCSGIPDYTGQSGL